jgi:hypothetical protein
LSELANSTVGQHSDTWNTDTHMHKRPASRRTGSHLHLRRPHGDMSTQGCTHAEHSATHGAIRCPTPAHPRQPDTHVPSQWDSTVIGRYQSTQPSMRAHVRSALGGCASPLGLFQVGASHVRPNVSFPNRRNLASSQQGRAGCVAGWVGGRVGMCSGNGMCEKEADM